MMSILIPSLSRAREQAKVAATNAEIRQIGLALDMYFDDYRKFPPTHEDCGTGKLTDHLYQLPMALITSRYLPSMPKREAMKTNMEDLFHSGHTYKYRSVGEIIVDRNKIEKYACAKLWIPYDFPEKSSIDPWQGRWRPDETEYNPYSRENKSRLSLLSPVSWVVFSLGPRFKQSWLEEKLGADDFNRYPVPKELWYTPKQRKGFIVRMRLKDETQIGSFETVNK